MLQRFSSYTNNVRGSQIVTEKTSSVLSDAEEVYLSFVDSANVDYKYATTCTIH